jgi:hypothetical protein
VGIVTQLTKATAPWRGSTGFKQLWTFHLVQGAAQGAAPTKVGVELRGRSIFGYLENGDWVEISEHPKPGRVYQPKVLRNLSDGGIVRVRELWHPEHR